MLDSRTAPERSPSSDAMEFVRFCYQRRRVGWPELYDEMCAVASRGLFRGWGSDELGAEGIGFSLSEMPALAALVHRIIAEDVDRRSRVTTASIIRQAHPVTPEAIRAAAEVAASTPVSEPEEPVDQPAPASPRKLVFVPSGA